MALFGDSLSTGSLCFLVLALALALGFEFVNGFHDTANAVATVIYTHTLKPTWAVVWSGCWNLLGVLASTGGVAFGILALLPVELVINVGSGAGFAMVFALLISAIIWNVGTWYFGLPASSSHTLIGSIMGVGLANSLLTPGHIFGEGVNWAKAKEAGLSLLISPVVGFVCAGALLLVLKLIVKRPELYTAPPKDQPPPLWIRGLLMLTCTGVSFFHGSNDGQKGMGLLMLILIGILPGVYSLNPEVNQQSLAELQASSQQASRVLDHYSQEATVKWEDAEKEISAYLKTDGVADSHTFAALRAVNLDLAKRLKGVSTLAKIPKQDKPLVRTEVYLLSEGMGKLAKSGKIPDASEAKLLASYRSRLEQTTKFIPFWVKVAVALALGLGTMVGWKRIVVTVGEKIGKEHLTYAQGASAELVAMGTIAFADHFNAPVSTTHVLSSGVAGTMAANHSGLQMGTLRNVLLAWVLTLPVCVLLGAATFSAALFVVFDVLGLK